MPEHFIKALKKSLQNDVLSMHQRRALEVLDAYMATQQRHCDPEKSTFQSVSFWGSHLFLRLVVIVKPNVTYIPGTFLRFFL